MIIIVKEQKCIRYIIGVMYYVTLSQCLSRVTIIQMAVTVPLKAVNDLLNKKFVFNENPY